MLTDQGSIGRPGESALLVEKRQESHGLAQQHIEHRSVVGELDQVHGYPLSHVFLLLPSEDMLVEVVLYLLVRYVDAELLERVPGEVLEAEDVEQPDRQRLVIRRAAKAQQTIDLIDHPIEQSAVETLCHGVACRTGLGNCIVPCNCLASGHDRV